MTKLPLTKEQKKKLKFVRDLGANGFPREFAENVLKAGCASERQALFIRVLYARTKQSLLPTKDDKYSDPTDEWQYYD